MKKTCINCKYFAQHYVKSNCMAFIKVENVGHCVHGKKTIKSNKTCECFVEKDLKKTNLRNKKIIANFLEDLNKKIESLYNYINN